MNKNFSSKIITATGVFHVNTNTQYMFGRSQTSLIKNVPYLNTLSRSYPGRPIAVNAALALEQHRLLTNKVVLLRFCEHLKVHSLSQLLNDRFLINCMSNYMLQEPTLHSRAFLLAIEVTYAKRKLEEDALRSYFENDFNIVDHFQTNHKLCDPSTMTTAILTKKFQGSTLFSKDELVVLSTPTAIPKEIFAKRSEEIQHFQNMTGNTAPDLIIREIHPYDHKDTKDIFYTKNHIYFIDHEKFLIAGNSFINNMETSLANSLRLATTSKEVALYTKDVISLIQNKKSSFCKPEETLNSIYTFINHSNPPKGFKIAYLIPTKKATLTDFPQELERITQVALDKGNLNSVKLHKAISGIISPWEYDLLQKAKQVTNNSLNLPNNCETVD